MIVDNTDDPEVLIKERDTSNNLKPTRLRDYLPDNSKSKILFTTRNRKVAGILTPGRILELNDMREPEAQQLLERRISKPALLHDKKAVSELLKIVTYLPLAIVQAAAFIDNNDISVSGYISLFQKAGTEAELFSEHFEDPSRYQEMENTIAKTWHISFDQMRRQDPLAAEYRSFMACINHINIPQSLLSPGGSPVQQTKAIGTLKGYTFITEHQQALQDLESEKFFNMHRLIHMASEWWLEEHNEQTSWTAEVAIRLEELIPYSGHEKKETWTGYLPHAIHVARLDGYLDEIARASLLDRISYCQASLGQYSAAEKTHRQALSLKERRLGTEHNETFRSMNDLGVALIKQGKYEAAETIYQQTLAQRKKVLGSKHPDTLTSINNLALLLDKQGKYKETEAMYQRTLAIRKKVLGLEHPSTLITMNNLAVLLVHQGKYEKAESMHRQELAITAKMLGSEHPDTLASMSNLAYVLDSQGKYEEAESMYQQTLAQFEKVLGPEHSQTLTNMSNLALVLDNQGKYEEAESMNLQTLVLRKKILGSEHPETSMSMHNLAVVLYKQGKDEEAESLLQQALAQCEKVLGSEHPDTLASVYSLAHLLATQQRYDESAALYKRACAGYSTVLGNEHPTTRACREHYSEMLGLQQHSGLAPRPEIPDNDVKTNMRSRLSRGLAKVHIRGLKLSRN